MKSATVSDGWWMTMTVGLYLLLALSLAWLARFQLNPDGVAYIQNARHLARGEFDLSISLWWSPLLSWLLVPFVWAKVDQVLAVKLLNIVFGLGFAVGVRTVVKELTSGPGSRIALIGGLLMALVMLPEPVTPDLLFTCLLTWYFALTMKLFQSDSVAAAATVGLLGGVAYLTKAYALPFVGLHLTMTMLLKSKLVKHGGITAGLKQYAAGLAVLAIVASPWVGAISLRERQLTIGPGKYWSTFSSLPAGKLPSPDRRLQLPREGRLTMWENPVETQLPWPTWSPLDGLTGLRYEFTTITQNVGLLQEYLGRADVLRLLPVGFIFAVVLLFPLRETVKTHPGILRLWACLSVALFVAGYLLVFLTERYLWPIWGMLLALAIAGPALPWPRDMGEEGPGATARAVPGRMLALWHRLLVFVLVASIAMNVGRTFYRWTGPGGQNALTANWKNAGDRFAPGCRFAASDYFGGLYVTYWARGVYLGELTGRTPEDIARELAPFGAVTVLVFHDTRLAAALSANPVFTRLELDNRVVKAFGLGGGACPAARRATMPASPPHALRHRRSPDSVGGKREGAHIGHPGPTP